MLCGPCYDSLHSSVLCVVISTRPSLLQLAAVLMDLRRACCTASLPCLTPTESATVRAIEGMQWHLCCMIPCITSATVNPQADAFPIRCYRINRLSTYNAHFFEVPTTAHFSKFPPPPPAPPPFLTQMSLLSPGPCCCSSVSTRQLEHVDLCKGPMVTALSTLSVEVHAGVVAAADKFFLELRRRYASHVHRNICKLH